MNEGVSICLGACCYRLLPRRVLLPHHHILYNGGREQDWLLPKQADL
jgi:hypothetical protein